jgi:geranylgeranyl pyrophosphate synthase
LKTIPLLEPLVPELERVEQKMSERVHPQHPQLRAALEHLLRSGGKRIRPALAILASRFYTVDLDRVVALGAAVEMLHTATLVHDDVVDGSLLRRGHATLNAEWSPGATILTGDYLFARAAALAAETDNVRVMHIFSQTLMTICNGELNQIFDRCQLPSTGHDDEWHAALGCYQERIYAKTASLFAAAAEAAAVLGDAPEAELTAFRDYGRFLGIAFQIVDDVLDFRGDQTLLGKPVGSDLRQGVVTLPVLLHLRQRPDDALLVEKALGSSATASSAVETVVNAVRASGSVDRALEIARDSADQSQRALKILPEIDARQLLYQLSDFIVTRQS